MNNPRPLMSIRKTVQLMVILTILAWATQTLFAQWGYGGLILPTPASLAGDSIPATAAAPESAPALERAPAAAPPAPAHFQGATVELRPRARFENAGRVALRDVCRWSDADAAVMEPLADTLIANLGTGIAVRQVTVDDIKSRLHDAGANLSLLQFTGSARCAILIGDAQESDLPPATETETPAPPAVVSNETSSEPVTATAPPQPQAPAEPQVIYEEQLVLTRPLSRGQRIIASDIAVKRVAVDGPATRPSISREEIIGNVASRDLAKGEVFDAEDIRRPAVVTKGQFMTVAMRIGEFEVETVARAMDNAALGETARAKNEANGDVYRVVITGPNAGRVASAAGEDVAVMQQN